MHWNGKVTGTSLSVWQSSHSFYVNIGIALHEALYERSCRSPICWDGVGAMAIKNMLLLKNYVDQVTTICKQLLAAQS